MKRRNFLGCSFLFIAGCTTASTTRSFQSSVAMPEKLRFTVTDTRSLQELQRDYEPFRAALAETLKTQIEFFPVEDMIAAAPAMLTGQVDLAWAGPSEYVLLNARAKAIPAVTLNRPNYHMVMITHKDNGVKTLPDLKGKTMDSYQFGGTASHLSPIKILLDAGVNPLDVNIIASGKRDISKLRSGEISAMPMAFSSYRELLEKKEISESEFVVLAKGPQLPGDVLAVSSQLEPQVVEAIRSGILANQDKLMQAILASEELEKFRGATFAVANDADYNMVREVYRAIGQDEVIQ